MAPTRMHQTTVRFAPDLWEELEAEAARSGVSAAQYVRDATLARLAFTAGQRSGYAPDGFGDGRQGDGGTSSDSRLDFSTVWAQARLARERARSVREEAHALQAQRRVVRRHSAHLRSGR